MSISTSTALLSPAQQTASVTPIAPLPDHALVMAQANQAFTDDANHVKLQGSGLQRMTYAVMCEAYRGLTNGSIPFKLADALTEVNSRTPITARLVMMFCGEKPDFKAVEEERGTEGAHAISKAWSAKEQLVKRGVELGSIMAAHNVPLSAFNAKTGVFAVFPKMLYPADATANGRLLEDATIALDGRSIVWAGKAKNDSSLVVKGQATAKQVLAICKPVGAPRKARAGAGTDADKNKVGSGATFNLDKFTEVAQHIKLPVLIAAVYQLFVLDTSAPMRLADMPQAFNMLTKIEERHHEHMAGKTWKLPLDADDKLADKPAAKPGKRKPGDEQVTRRNRAA